MVEAMKKLGHASTLKEVKEMIKNVDKDGNGTVEVFVILEELRGLVQRICGVDGWKYGRQ